EWVYGVENRREYMKRLGAEKILKLMVKPYYSFPVNYGYYG
ncbi:CoA transferase subunit A, partial [Candidatus Bathyarchaeota archaeon]|nr:CoA transferase subunit A [Candidatus Bathyarchaeota archaeon]